jgi:phosphoribosylformylglycinamidine synthase
MCAKKATVYVRLKEGVLDPQGLTIQKAIHNMGYDEVMSVRSGRFFELELSSRNGNVNEKVDEVCRKLISNPVIENYTVEYEE